jgi:hypothetical protein
MLCNDIIEHIFSYLPVFTVRTLNKKHKLKSDKVFCIQYPHLYHCLLKKWYPVIKKRIYYRSCLNDFRMQSIKNKYAEIIPDSIDLHEAMLDIRNLLYKLNTKKQKLILEYRLLQENGIY